MPARTAQTNDFRRLHRRIAAYYTSKVQEFGCTPFGADWTCIATQQMRFVQLLRLCDFNSHFTINDLGCGYGALVAFMRDRYDVSMIDYLGIDLSGEMIRRAISQWQGVDGVRFVAGDRSPRKADYTVASGIFNVRLGATDRRWERLIKATFDQLAETSGRGFAVNFVEAAAGGSIIRGLYTTRPEVWLEYCRVSLGAEGEVIRGYGLREFTLLVRQKVTS